ncbi:MAG: sirohydrochlorin cobaltochelatase [Clostridiales bacterium]|nr:sirohydrochlorin cobaltochelatase [Clostridiales bacterium]
MILLVSLLTGCADNHSQASDTGPLSGTEADAPETNDDESNDTGSPSGTEASAPEANNDENNEEDNSDGYEEGTSAADGIVNTTPADKVILVVSFGTSFNQSRSLTIGGIEAAIREAYPDYQIRRAFTSQIIIDKLAAREGLRIDTVEDAMNRLILDKVKEVVIQPTTVMNGWEYEDIIKEVMPFADKFESFRIGKWLLADDDDYDVVAGVMAAETNKFKADGTAIVWMGHGTSHESNATYLKMQNVLHAKGYTDHLVGTVEGYPEIEDVEELLEEMAAERVVLRPMMIVAGDHANNDMAGDEEDSWKIILEEDGYGVESVIEGFGQVKAIQDLFVNHVQDALDADDLAVTLAATAAGVTAERTRNGTYAIEVDTNSAMFKFVDCQLNVEDTGMTAVVTMSGVGFDMVYWGTLAQAEADESNAYKPVLNDGHNVYTIPLEALDRKLNCAGRGDRSGKWYDHIVEFKSDSLSPEAFLPCKIDVAMTGGTGKSSIESPTALFYKDGVNIAQVVWSSPNYTYMIVSGATYLPVNTEGNSTFEIPVMLDTDMTIIACTVAMSEPKEIEYVLHFDSASIH